MPKGFEHFKKGLLVGKQDNGSAEPGPYHEPLLKHVKGLIDISRKEMAKHYATWDYHDQIFRSKRAMDKEDRAANAKGAPAKLIVPLTFSQIMTFVAFSVMNVTQNERFYELQQGNNDAKDLKEIMEVLLERDCKRNGWNSFLVQFFLDVSRFWLGCAEVCYKEEYRMMRVTQEVEQEGAFGVMQKTNQTSFQKVPKFVGNKVYPISPYRFFPDTRLPLTRFQEGEFCGSEDMFSMSSLRSDSDNLFNLDWIPKMSEKQYGERKSTSRIDDMDFIPSRSKDQDGSMSDSNCQVRSGAVVVTKVVFDLIPNNFVVNDERPLGDEQFPIRYICWIANDSRIIRFDEAYYLHGQFPYVCAQYLPDQHQIVNEGLSSVCDQITNLITWKLNAHMTSQKATLDSKFIIDPAGVDIKSLESRSPYIFLKRNASQTGVDRYIKQFVTQDPTQGVMPDIASLKDLLESITGISGQMQGQYSQGRRSATQDRVVAQGASARAKTTLMSIWQDGLAPLGQQFLSNNRQEMDFDTFRRIVGSGPFGPNAVPVEDLYALFKADPITIASSEDFFVFDGTLPSEKAFLAQSLQEIFTTIFTNPQIAGVLGYGPEQIRYLFNEIYTLRGVTPPSMPAPAPVAPQPTLPIQAPGAPMQ